MQKRSLGADLLTVMARLQRVYGAKRRIRRATLLEQVLLGLLSVGISTGNALRAMQRISSEFVDLNEFRVSVPRDVLELLAPAKVTEQGARLAEAFLCAIFEKTSALSLEDVERSKANEAYEWLTNLRGSPPQAAAEAVLGWFGAPFFPIDADLHRVLNRLGVFQDNKNDEATRRHLQRLVRRSRWYSAYHLLSDHAVLHCTPEDFDCATCPIQRFCQTGQQESLRTARQTSANAEAPGVQSALAPLTSVATGVQAHVSRERPISKSRDVGGPVRSNNKSGSSVSASGRPAPPKSAGKHWK